MSITMKILVIVFVIFSLQGTTTPLCAETCVTAICHTNIGAYQNPHQPVKVGNCSSCHQQTVKEHPLKGAKSFGLIARPAVLCKKCHNTFGNKKLAHSPFKNGDCIACHNPHGTNGSFLLDDSEDRSKLCFGCHDRAPFSQKYVHGPVAAGSCDVCHDPHQSDLKALLKRSSRDLCLSCHSDFAQKMQAATTIHPPVKNEPCTSCHNPHSSISSSLIKLKMPDLCIRCHAGIGKKLNSAKNIHKPVLEGKLCGNCHSTHFSSAKGLLTADEKNLCLSCHNTDKLGKPPLKNILQELKGENKKLHGPILKNQCRGCHDPHASDFANMFPGNFPTGFYAPYKEGNYDLCLRCHEKNLLRYPETTIYTKFRNGKQNLHYIHVVDERKGRSCISCHVSHAVDGQKLISKEGAAFGDWKIPIRFIITPTGGSCAPGCHVSIQYDREKPVPYNKENK